MHKMGPLMLMMAGCKNWQVFKCHHLISHNREICNKLSRGINLSLLMTGLPLLMSIFLIFTTNMRLFCKITPQTQAATNADDAHACSCKLISECFTDLVVIFFFCTSKKDLIFTGLEILISDPLCVESSNSPLQLKTY